MLILFNLYSFQSGSESCSVVSNSSQPHGLQPTRLLCQQDPLGKNTGVGCYFLLQNLHDCLTNTFGFKNCVIIYMEFRKMVMIILYAKQKKRHRCTEQNFGLWEKARVGCFERTACILSKVKQITSPGWMHETSARAWCTGKTHRNQVEREVGGGIGMGNTCNSMADSCQCMTKPTTML